MIAVHLPDYTQRMERPVYALVDTPIWYESDDERRLPPHAVILKVPRPSTMLMCRVPDVMPGDPDAKVLWESWLDDVLARAVAEPQLTSGDIELRGPDRDVLTATLLRIWGWFAEHSDQECPAPVSSRRGPRCDHYPYMPNRALLTIVTFVSMRLKTPPHELLAWHFDDLMLAWRALRVANPETELGEIGA